jgi:hypothetical protein
MVSHYLSSPRRHTLGYEPGAASFRKTQDQTAVTKCDLIPNEVPYLIAGSGGCSPVEKMWEKCDGKDMAPARRLPFKVRQPKHLTFPDGEEARVVAYHDHSFGFLRVTIASEKLTGEFFTAARGLLTIKDVFVLDMETYQVRTINS